MGCGWGNISFALLKEGFNVTGLDYSKRSIQICRKISENLSLDSSKFICADATNTGFTDNSFDVIYCSDIVEHLYPDVYGDMLKELYRILKKGGNLIIFTPCPTHIFEVMKKNDFILKKDISHVDLKTMEKLRKSLNKANFRIIKSFYISSHIQIIRFFENLLIRFFPLFRRRIAILANKK